MATLPNFEINGVIDTSQSVMSNLNTLCTAAGCWLTFDSNSGLWSVVINKPGNSIKSFTDSNIIGNINIAGSGINEMYNSVSVEFPHKDLRDQTDYIDMEVAAADRYPQELDNNLQMSFQCMNSPIQAQYIGTVELKQSRVDKIIEFRTDYTSLGLKAGDIIDITSEMYGYTNKKFRITKMTEEDSDDGNIQIAITALEYDANVYDSGDLIQTERNRKTGILPKAQNTALTDSDNAAFMAKGYMISVDCGLVTTADIPASANATDYQTAYTQIFTAPLSGRYIFNVIVDQNGSAAKGRLSDNIAAAIVLADASANVIFQETSGGYGAYYWTDFAMAKEATLVAGQQYQLIFLGLNYTPEEPGNTMSVTWFWNIYTVKPPELA